MGKDIYQSKEWRELDPLSRAETLLVLEKVKSGSTSGVCDFTKSGLQKKIDFIRSIANGNELSFRVTHTRKEDIDRSQLESLSDQELSEFPEEFIKDPGFYEATYDISSQMAFDQRQSKIQNLPNDPHQSEINEINGNFYGYPDCCITEYSRDKTEEEMQLARERQSPHCFSYGLTKDLREGKDSELLKYAPPSFGPCSVNCPDATDMLRMYKETLEANDVEAAEAVVKFNRR